MHKCCRLSKGWGSRTEHDWPRLHPMHRSVRRTGYEKGGICHCWLGVHWFGYRWVGVALRSGAGLHFSGACDSFLTARMGSSAARGAKTQVPERSTFRRTSLGEVKATIHNSVSRPAMPVASMLGRGLRNHRCVQINGMNRMLLQCEWLPFCSMGSVEPGRFVAMGRPNSSWLSCHRCR